MTNKFMFNIKIRAFFFWKIPDLKYFRGMFPFLRVSIFQQEKVLKHILKQFGKLSHSSNKPTIA
jgi:hypothetical protein